MEVAGREGREESTGKEREKKGCRRKSKVKGWVVDARMSKEKEKRGRKGDVSLVEPVKKEKVSIERMEEGKREKGRRTCG